MEDMELSERIQRDYTRDARGYVHLLKIIVICLCVVIALMTVAFAVVFGVLETNHQNRMAEVANHASDKMVELLTEYDWEVEYEIESTNNEFMSGNITVEK